MATLSAADLGTLRREAVKAIIAADGDVDFVKAIANAVFQAIEDWFDKPAVQASLSADIDAATDPVVLSNLKKKKLVKAWLRHRWGRE